MADSVSKEEMECSNRIYALRVKNHIVEAIEACNEAITKYPKSNFFYKIKGDLLFETNEYEKAITEYMSFLENIQNKPEYVTNFTKFMRKVNQVKVIGEDTLNKIARIIIDEKYSYIIRKSMLNLILDIFIIPDRFKVTIERGMESSSVNEVKCDYEEIKSVGLCRELIYLCKISEKACKRADDSLNRYILKKLEMSKLYIQGIDFAKKILEYSTDAVVIRTLFRLCRECSDYSVAEKYLLEHNIEEVKEFNIQYELVLYFDTLRDEVKRNRALQCIEELSQNSLPISKTLFKFYVKYNLLGKAQRIQERIMSFTQNNSTQKVKKETENIVWERLRNLVTEQEHNRQLLAMAELVKGFAHELGQPITNIRYAIQLYYMKNKKYNMQIEEEEMKLLDSILVQTERVGKLLNRFAPIVSSKSTKQYFNIYNAISNVFDELSTRLHAEDIRFDITGRDNIEVYGEELQFGQVFYNLIINSISAINKGNRKGYIKVELTQNSNIIGIAFSDNGIGIKPEIRAKVFEPFYTTKNKELEEGGEGLGLFIVWNILKIFSGRIRIDEKYRKGARFIIEINEKENKHV